MTCNDIDQLWQFIKAVPAQPASDSRYPGVVFQLVVKLPLQQMLRMKLQVGLKNSICVGNHGAELEGTEWFAIAAITKVAEK